MSLFSCVDPPPLFASPIRLPGSSVVNSKLRYWMCREIISGMMLHCCAACYPISYPNFHVFNLEEVLRVFDSWLGDCDAHPYSFSLAFFQRTC